MKLQVQIESDEKVSYRKQIARQHSFVAKFLTVHHAQFGCCSSRRVAVCRISNFGAVGPRPFG